MSVRATILDNLESELTTMVDSEDFDSLVAKVSRFEFNFLSSEHHKTPMITILDSGDEAIQVEDETHIRYKWNIFISGFVKSSTPQLVQTEYNQLIASIKTIVDAGMDLGENVFRIKVIGPSTTWYDETNNRLAGSHLDVEIIYWAERGTF